MISNSSRLTTSSLAREAERGKSEEKEENAKKEELHSGAAQRRSSLPPEAATVQYILLHTPARTIHPPNQSPLTTITISSTTHSAPPSCPVCVTCAYPADHLYTTYKTPSNIRLAVCVSRALFISPMVILRYMRSGRTSLKATDATPATMQRLPRPTDRASQPDPPARLGPPQTPGLPSSALQPRLPFSQRDRPR